MTLFILYHFFYAALLTVHAQCVSPLETALSSCLSKANVRNILDGDKTWAQETLPFQLRLKPDPAVISFPNTRDQIAAALRCAVENNAKVSCLGGDHSFGAFGFGKPGNLVINLGAFTRIVSFQEGEKGLFTFEGGIRVGPAAKWLWDNYQRHFPHVRAGHVGLTGSACGGGFGSTTRFLGTTLDTIEAVEYMAYNGTIIKATQYTNSDLLWATKGAGPSMGVILTMTVRTWKPKYQRAVNFTLDVGDVDLETGAKALLTIQDFALKGAPEEWALRWKLTSPPYQGIGYYYEDPAKFDQIMQPLMQKLPGGSKLRKDEYDFFTLDSYVAPGLDQPNGGDSPGRAFYVQSLTMTAAQPFTQDLATTLYKYTTYAFKRDDMKKSGYLDLWGGFSQKTKDTEQVAAYGNNLWLIRWQADAVKDWPADGVDYLKKQMLPFENALLDAGYLLRGYINYPDTQLTFPEWRERLFGVNFERLQEIKRKVDPDGLFTSNDQSIPV
ncbi:hypothetical protein IWX90DRAFT_410257 [Phyllosticta citrichinensis]|uniref:FAD-binding PCMH-type domain-containing protein n=1 Tax=Phyllosticta citrichinensis TaxID=1130410 RepID=A0ABR1XER2_9PEZI